MECWSVVTTYECYASKGYKSDIYIYKDKNSAIYELISFINTQVLCVKDIDTFFKCECTRSKPITFAECENPCKYCSDDSYGLDDPYDSKSNEKSYTQLQLDCFIERLKNEHYFCERCEDDLQIYDPVHNKFISSIRVTEIMKQTLNNESPGTIKLFDNSSITIEKIKLNTYDNLLFSIDNIHS